MASARALRAGRAVVELSLAGGPKVEKMLMDVQKRANEISRAMMGVGKQMLATGASIASTFIVPIKAASDLQETMSKFNTVFGANSDVMKAWSDAFAQSVGRSKKQVAEFVSGSQDLFVPIGFDTTTATELSKDVTEMAFDLASFNNMRDEDTLRDLHAALTGSGEVMKKYGVIVSEAAVKQELLNQSIDPRVATEAQKTQARWNLILAGTTAAQGDAIRTSGSFANQMKRLQGSFMDTMATLGGALLPGVTKLVQWVNEGVGRFGRFIEENQRLVRAVAMVAGGLAGMLLVGGAFAVVLGGAFSIVSTVAGALAGAIGLVSATLAVLVSPIGIAVAAISGLVGWFVTSTDAGRQMVNNLGQWFTRLGNTLGKTFGGIMDALEMGNLAAAGEVAMAGLNVAWLEGTSFLREGWASFTGWLIDMFTDAVFGLKKLWADLSTNLQMGWAELEGGAKSLGETIGHELSKTPGDEDQERAHQKALSRIQEEVNKRKAALEVQRQDEKAQLKRDRDKAASDRAAEAFGDELAAQLALEDAQRKLRDLTQSIADEKAARGAEFDQTPDPGDIAATLNKVARAATASASKSIGTFDPRLAAQMFGHQGDESLATLRKIEANTRRRIGDNPGLPVGA